MSIRSDTGGDRPAPDLERSSDEWLHEPLPDSGDWCSRQPGGTTAEPATRLTMDEPVSMAFLILLESMTPAERLAFILHDVLGYSVAEVAEATSRTRAAGRQLAS